MSSVPSRPVLSQCPACGLTVEETEGFKPAVWLKTHQKTCALVIGARGTATDAVATKAKKGKAKAGDAAPAPDTASAIGEKLVQQFASAFVKQMFKKGK